MPEQPPPSPGHALELSDLGVAREGTSILRAVDLALASGSVHGLIGPNGSGKSTLLHAIAGLIHHSGTVRRGGRVALMGTQPGWHPSRRLADHLRVLRRRPEIDGRTLDALVARFALVDLLQRAPRSMSLGQQRAVSLLGPLATTAPVLLLDEPFLALDAGRVAVLEQLITESASAGGAVLVSSHEAQPLSRVASHVMVLSDGRLAFHGPMADYLHDVGPSRVRVVVPDLLTWDQAAREEWDAPVRVLDDGSLLLDGVDMRQVLDVARRRDLTLHGIWDESPTLATVVASIHGKDGRPGRGPIPSHDEVRP